MRIFKAALLMFFRHPVYLLIYVVFMSAMGVFIGLSATPEAASDEYVERPSVAVVDRDGGVLAEALGSFIADNSEVVEVADSERALQDAVMQRQVDYVAVIPEGFTDAFMAYAREGEEAPVVGTAVVDTSVAYMMDNLVNEYLGIARLYAVALPAEDAAGVASHTAAAMSASSDISIVKVADEPPASDRYRLYMQFASYTISISIGVCVAVVMSRFGREELRRRNAASPVRALSANLQVAAACLVLALICWAFVMVLGLAVFGGDIAGIGAASVAAVGLALACYALFGLAFGFFLGQLTSNEIVMNAIANIVGLAMSFLGGVWIPLSIVGEPISTIAHFMPSFYYCDALFVALDPATSGFSAALLADMGMIVLFAVALFAVALAVSRARSAAGVRPVRAAAAS